MEHEFISGDRIYTINLEKRDGKFKAVLDNREFEIDLYEISSNHFSILIENKSYSVYHFRRESTQYIVINGHSYCFEIGGEEDTLGTKTDKALGEGLIIKAPMPGTILKIDVKEGDTVEEGECLAVVEAMKMETGLYSTVRAKVKKIFVDSGRQVDGGEVIIELEKI